MTEARIIYWDVYGDIRGGFYIPGSKAEHKGKSIDQLAALVGHVVPECVNGWDITDTNPWEPQNDDPF